jgi:hypothetical protein
MSCRAKSRHPSINGKRLTRSLPAHSASGLPVHVAASQLAPFLDSAEFTLSARSVSNGLRSE